MSSRLGQGEFLARNPQVNPQRVEKTREMIRRFREFGFRRGNDATAPFGEWHGVARDDRPATGQPPSRPQPSSGTE